LNLEIQFQIQFHFGTTIIKEAIVMKHLFIVSLAGILLTACNFQESNDNPEIGNNNAQKFSDQEILESMVNGGFSAEAIRFEGTRIIYQGDVSMDRENVEREIQDLIDGNASTLNDPAPALAKKQQRALNSNPKVTISELPKLWYSLSPEILGIAGLAGIIHDSYAEYQDETNFEFVYTTNYAWCNNTPYKCTRWSTNSALTSLALASWPWKTSAAAPPFKVFTAPGSTIEVKPSSWNSSVSNPTPLKTILHEIGHTLGYTHSNVAEGGTQVIPGTSSTTIASVMCANFSGVLGACTNYSFLPTNDRVALKWSGYRTANP
jgi:hypothetical protein